MGTVHALRQQPPTPTVADALAAWVEHLPTVRGRSGHVTSAATVRAYRTAVGLVVDPSRAVADYDTADGAQTLRDAVRARWGAASPSTWNARRAAVAAFVSYCRERGWLSGDPLDGLARTSQPRPAERARPRAEVERLLDDQRHSLRDRTLWALAYESCARIAELLALDVADVDLRNSRATVTRKGGQRDVITWDRGGRAARRLARYLDGRTWGPLFLTHRRAVGVDTGRVAPADLGPGDRGRLGYRAALETLRDASGGWTPHDLRHSGTTHSAEDGVPVPLLMAKTGHADIRSLARYARPSAEAAQRAAEDARSR